MIVCSDTGVLSSEYSVSSVGRWSGEPGSECSLWVASKISALPVGTNGLLLLLLLLDMPTESVLPVHTNSMNQRQSSSAAMHVCNLCATAIMMQID